MLAAPAPLALDPEASPEEPLEEGPFVGRAADLATLGRLVREGARAIVVAGPAGVGKSRLVLRWAREHLDEGTRFARADLGAATDLEEARRRIGRALGLEFGPTDATDAVDARIASALRHRSPAVLALDDADAVIEPLGALLEGFCAALPRVCFVVTSRRARLSSTHDTLTLGPLALGDAEALLVAHARRVRPGFVVRAGQRESVHALVARVDALPLGIELLAPRLRLLSPARLLARLEGPTGPQGALRQALDRSFGLLTPSERRALAECTVFRDGFTLEAAEAVLSAPEGGLDVLTVLESLVDQSLLRAEAVPELADDVRLRFFEAVRERAAEELDEEARRRVEARHAEVFVAAGEAWDAGIESPEEAEHTARLVVELPNLEAAFARAEDAGIRARLGLVLHMAYQRRGPFSRHAALAEEVRALALSAGSPRTVARAELALARAHRWSGALDAADAALGRALEAATRAADVETIAGAHRNLAATAWARGDLTGFEAHLTQALEAADQSGRASDAVNALNGLGFLHAHRGELERARETLERALRLAQETRIPGLVALVHGSLSSTLLRAERFEAAERHASAAIAAYEGLGYLRQWALELLVRAEGRLYADDLAGAHDDAAAALSRARWLGLAAPLSRALALRGKVAFFEQDWGAARESLEEAAAEPAAPAEAARLFAYVAAARAMLGHLEAAEQALLHAADDEVGEVLRAFVRLGAAKVASLRGEAVALAPLAERRRGAEARRLAELLTESARALGPGRAPLGVRLEVREGARWFRVEDGEEVDLGRRRALRGVLAGLVAQALARPGAPLSLDEVLEAGWPGERMSPESGARRVYVTINRLRNLGLGELLETTGDGYALASHVQIRRVP